MILENDGSDDHPPLWLFDSAELVWEDADGNEHRASLGDGS